MSGRDVDGFEISGDGERAQKESDSVRNGHLRDQGDKNGTEVIVLKPALYNDTNAQCPHGSKKNIPSSILAQTQALYKRGYFWVLGTFSLSLRQGGCPPNTKRGRRRWRGSQEAPTMITIIVFVFFVLAALPVAALPRGHLPSCPCGSTHEGTRAIYSTNGGDSGRSVHYLFCRLPPPPHHSDLGVREQQQAQKPFSLSRSSLAPSTANCLPPSASLAFATLLARSKLSSQSFFMIPLRPNFLPSISICSCSCFLGEEEEESDGSLFGTPSSQRDPSGRPRSTLRGT